MLINAIQWKFLDAKNLESIFDSKLNKPILSRFPENLVGIDYELQDIPDVVADGFKQTFTKKLLPSLANQETWIDEYKTKRLPTVQWENKMRKSDGVLIDRNMENLIRQNHGGKATDPILQEKYNKKIIMRKEKPI